MYTSNTSSSSASSVISDSDVEIDETSSTISNGQFSTTGAGSFASIESSAAFPTDLKSTGPSQHAQQPATSSVSDIANLNDFLDVEMQSIIDSSMPASDEQFKMSICNFNISVRPLSAASNDSSSSSSNEACDMASVPIISMNDLCDSYMEQSYVHLKLLCIEQIKRPGRDYLSLFRMLEKCRSQLTIRLLQFLIKELIFEAERFKRNELIQQLNRYSELLDNLRSVTANGITVTPVNGEPMVI